MYYNFCVNNNNVVLGYFKYCVTQNAFMASSGRLFDFEVLDMGGVLDEVYVDNTLLEKTFEGGGYN